MQIKIAILFLIIGLSSFAQKTENNFTFNDGIFLTFNDFKSNNSIAFSQIISDIQLNNTSSINDILKKKKIIFFDNNGIQQERKTKTIWGYCFNNKIYIHFNNEYNIIPIVGNISHFVANKQVYHNTYVDPFDAQYTSGYNNYRTSEPQEYILDFNSGAVYEFNIKNFSLLLSKDEKLYTEFANLKKRQQRQMIYIYLRRFNKDNPIIFSKN